MVFRVSRSMRREILAISKFENYTSYGEYFRSLQREHSREILNSAAYKTHLRLRAEEEEMKKREADAANQKRLS